jgi:plasmid stabilization system protein ParE
VTSYSISSEAQKDLFEIWVRIARDSVDLANRIEAEFYSRFESLGQTPGQGHTRKDLTKRNVLFSPLYSFLIIYQPEPRPIRILAILRGRRNVKRILKDRP